MANIFCAVTPILILPRRFSVITRDGQKLQKDFLGNKPVYLHFCNFGLYFVCMYCMYFSSVQKKSPERSQYSEASLHQGPPWTERLFHHIKLYTMALTLQPRIKVRFPFNITFPICEQYGGEHLTIYTFQISFILTVSLSKLHFRCCCHYFFCCRCYTMLYLCYTLMNGMGIMIHEYVGIRALQGSSGNVLKFEISPIKDII